VGGGGRWGLVETWKAKGMEGINILYHICKLQDYCTLTLCYPVLANPCFDLLHSTHYQVVNVFQCLRFLCSMLETSLYIKSCWDIEVRLLLGILRELLSIIWSLGSQSSLLGTSYLFLNFTLLLGFEC
jgi:hypothetical protein